MHLKYTVIFAYRNRDSERVKLSLESLSKQTNTDFKVVFVDYGSEESYADKVRNVVESFSFASYHYIAHCGLLWNKSKALNYGIYISKSEFVVLADVDVLFAPNFIDTLDNYTSKENFTLFKINYLDKTVQPIDIIEKPYNQLKVSHCGNTFGIGLFPKIALEKVNGLDTFFHFYGSEDEDLNARLNTVGYNQQRCLEPLLWHQWHPTYNKDKEDVLTVSPRLTNIKRINQRHFLYKKEQGVITPCFSENWNDVYLKIDRDKLNHPTETYTLHNIQAHVIHFLRYILPSSSVDKKVIKVVFKQDDYYKSIKHKVKQALNKESQKYISLKEVNDLVLTEIVFQYKNYNYCYEVAKDLETISFTVDLNID